MFCSLCFGNRVKLKACCSPLVCPRKRCDSASSAASREKRSSAPLVCLGRPSGRRAKRLSNELGAARVDPLLHYQRAVHERGQPIRERTAIKRAARPPHNDDRPVEDDQGG